jgi:hypothetical protein
MNSSEQVSQDAHDVVGYWNTVALGEEQEVSLT